VREQPPAEASEDLRGGKLQPGRPPPDDPPADPDDGAAELSAGFPRSANKI